MQAEDVRTLRQSAVPTAVIGVLCGVAAWFAAGGKGLLGAAIGLAVVTVFFMISSVVLNRAAKSGPQSLMVAAMSSYLIKIILLVLLTAEFRDTSLFNGKAFGLTAIACVLAWSATQVRTLLKAKLLYVEPGPSPLNQGGQ